jgi:hypothetical protein
MIRFRKALKHFKEKDNGGRTVIRQYFCIEALLSGRWRLCGDDTGLFKYRSEGERDAKLSALRDRR